MTEKLFYEDSHTINFSAVVQSCEKVGEYYEAVLDRTAFFPEAGGQYADTGTIDEVKVLDVQERNDYIYHIIESPIEVGRTVKGHIFWKERLMKMQHHSAEHIVSGIINSKYGYDNTGFHLGKDAITMDFNGPLSKEELKEIERQANEVVVQNLEIEVLYPTREKLKSIFYRSKMEIEGQVRIVRIPGCDSCACCAPHVKHTGEIGLIKLVSMQNYKGGVRISMLCGSRALEDYNEKAESVKTIAVQLSAKEREVSDEVSRLWQELLSQRFLVAQLQSKLLRYKVEQILNEQSYVAIFEAELDGNQLREFANLLLEKDIKVAAVFSGNEKQGYRYVIGSKVVDVRAISKILNDKFQGRGGGKPIMVQGSLYGSEQIIREEIERLCKE